MKNYRKKNNVSKRLKKLEKKVALQKPELKQVTTDVSTYIDSYNTGPAPQGQIVFSPLDIFKGINSNQRIGDEIRAISYYGVFYFTIPAGSGAVTASVRMIHYLTDTPNHQTLDDNQGEPMAFDEIPRDLGIVTYEDKLICLSLNGPRCRKVVIKGKFKYPPRVKWDTVGNERHGNHPKLMFVSDTAETTQSLMPQVHGHIRYYYNDA